MKRLDELEKIARQLDPDARERQFIGGKANQYAEKFLESLTEMPGYTTGSFNKLQSLQIDENPKPLEMLLDILESEVDVTGINTASGRHLGFIPGGGLWASSVADMLADITNRYAGIAYSNPGAVKIENQLIEWLITVVGYPEKAFGNLTSGGSIANLIAIKAARDHHHIHSDNVKKSVIYFSEQVHHCVHKAFHITGLHEAVLRHVSMNDKFQLDAEELRKQIMKDKSDGLNPFLVIASAGTTDTGAVDPLDKIADICSEFNTWFHVDAAYGGFFILVDEMKEKLKGMERSDSVVLDPHKTLFMPYGSGAVLLRDKDILLASNSYKANYMKDSFEMKDVNPADTGPELSRHNRGLRMWLPLHLHGIAPFKAALEEKLLLCRYFYQHIKEMDFETGPDPDLSVCIFRYPKDNDNSINQKLIDAIHDDGRVFLSSTTIDRKLWIRCAVVSHRTHLPEIEMALEMIEENMKKVAH